VRAHHGGQDERGETAPDKSSGRWFEFHFVMQAGILVFEHDASRRGSRQNQFVKKRATPSRLQTSARHSMQIRRLFENRRPSCEPIPIPALPGFPAYFAAVLSSGMRIA
jgi:hypothetical protein